MWLKKLVPIRIFFLPANLFDFGKLFGIPVLVLFQFGTPSKSYPASLVKHYA